MEIRFVWRSLSRVVGDENKSPTSLKSKGSGDAAWGYEWGPCIPISYQHTTEDIAVQRGTFFENSERDFIPNHY